LAQNRPGPIRRRRDEEGRVRVEEQAVDATAPKWKPVVNKDVREKWPCVGARESLVHMLKERRQFPKTQ
jgi:hypothetical protein